MMKPSRSGPGVRATQAAVNHAQMTAMNSVFAKRLTEFGGTRHEP